MTVKTTLQQNCVTVLDALGSTKFQIDSALTYVAPGDLPTAGIFVYQVGTVSDPKTDTFLRVGSIQDITSLVIGRTNALLESDTIYLATGFTVLYSDVNTAIAAKQLIQARVDQLIADWRAYTLLFISPDFALFPLQDASLVAAKKSAYTAALSAKAAADAAAAPLVADVAAKQAAALAAADLQVLRLSIYSDCATTQSAVHATVSPEAAFMAAVSGVVAALNALLPDTTSADLTVAKAASASRVAYLQGLATSLATSLATATQLVSMPVAALDVSLTTACAAKLGASNAAAASRAVADAAIGAAQRAAILAVQTATTAQATVEQALADVLEVCPTFDPSAT